MHFPTHLVINHFSECFGDIKVLNIPKTWVVFPKHRITMITEMHIVDLRGLCLDKLYALKPQ